MFLTKGTEVLPLYKFVVVENLMILIDLGAGRVVFYTKTL